MSDKTDLGGVLANLNLQGLNTADYLRAEARLSPEQRSGLAMYLAAALDPDRLSKEDFAHAEAILRLLVWSSEAQVVETLARAAAGNPNTPKSIAWALANDDEAAAAPILETSSMLTDADLIAIAQTTSTPSKLTAIARRAAVNEEVAQALVEHGDEATVRALLANPNAVITDAAVERMGERFAADTQIRNAISARKIAKLTLPGYREERSADEVQKRIAQLIAQRSLNEFLLIGELCLGNFEFFCRALAVLAKATEIDVCAALLVSASTELPGFWAKAGLPSDWLPLARAAVAAVIQIDAEVGKSDTKLFARNIGDRTQALLRTDKVKLNDAQRRFFLRQGRP